MSQVTMQNAKNNQSGFSLVELMVVVTIIGILAGVAVPRFATFKAKASQTEAKALLNAVYLSAQAYETNYQALPPQVARTDLYVRTSNTAITRGDANFGDSRLGFAVQGSSSKYNLNFISNGNGWAAAAASQQAFNTNGTTNQRDVIRINTNKWTCSVWDGIAASGSTAPLNTAPQTASRPTDCPQNTTAAITGAGINFTYAALDVVAESDAP